MAFGVSSNNGQQLRFCADHFKLEIDQIQRVAESYTAFTEL